MAIKKAWDQTNGIKDNKIFASRIFKANPAYGDTSLSETDVLSFHVRPPATDRIPNRGDAELKAFVKLFKENSEMRSEYIACMPKQ